MRISDWSSDVCSSDLINTVGGVPLNIGLYPATHPVAQYLGARPIGPEKSKNYSIGITLTHSNGFTMTVDAYRINISDQIYATKQIGRESGRERVCQYV